MLADPRGVEPDGLREPHELDRVPVLPCEGTLRSGRDLAREQPDADAHRHARTLPPGAPTTLAVDDHLPEG
jgi:hypothetical protein